MFRAAIRRGESIRYLVHDDVETYLRETGLYSATPVESPSAGASLQ